MTRTALAAGMAVLGTLVLLRHRSGTDVATSTVGKTAPGATDVEAGGCAHAVSPVGGKENRQMQVVLPPKQKVCQRMLPQDQTQEAKR